MEELTELERKTGRRIYEGALRRRWVRRADVRIKGAETNKWWTSAECDETINEMVEMGILEINDSGNELRPATRAREMMVEGILHGRS